MFGIDQQVQQRVDAYRGNPQQLQQRYAKEKDIFDLIALNQITEQQESAANQMRLAAAKKGTPPSIYEKKESQALDNAKKEVMDEQAGVMQNKMQQMQDAQKKALQAAGAPQMPGQAMPQPQQPPAPGLAGLAAPNIQGMAGGGIVAFRTGDAVEGDAGEAEARRYIEEQRQRQAAPPPQTQQAAPQGNMQAGLARLLGIDPEAIYQSRRSEAARDANLSAQETASKRALNAEREAFEMRNKLGEALTAGSGYVSGAAGLANIGRTAVNVDRNAMQRRHDLENQIIDMGPVSRMAGTKAGEAGYTHAMPGLYHGVDAAARMAQTGEMAANRAQAIKDANDLKSGKLANDIEAKAREAADKNPIVVGLIKEITTNGMGMDAPENVKRLQDIHNIQRQIYKARGLNPDDFVPPPVAAVPTPPKPPGMLDRVFGAGTPKPKIVPFGSLQP